MSFQKFIRDAADEDSFQSQTLLQGTEARAFHRPRCPDTGHQKAWGFMKNNRGRNQMIATLKEPIRTHLT